jgi:hypothetical protein
VGGYDNVTLDASMTTAPVAVLRLNPNLLIGGYFQYGFGLLNNSSAGVGQVGCNSSGVSCSANDLMFGVQAHYHFMPGGTFDPWGGIGVGYEIANASASANGQSVSVAFSGFQFVNLQVGGDYKAMPNLGIGPFVMPVPADHRGLDREGRRCDRERSCLDREGSCLS